MTIKKKRNVKFLLLDLVFLLFKDICYENMVIVNHFMNVNRDHKAMKELEW
jgi:hypothetical protein